MDSLSNIIQALFVEIANFGNSATFAVIKFLIGIYVLVLTIDIILMLFQRGLGGDLREALIGMNIPREFVNRKSKAKNRWDAIKKRMESQSESEYKVAIIEADNLIDDLIRRLGYKGDNLTEILDKIPSGQIANIEELKKAHEARNRIVHDDHFQLSKSEASEIMSYYERFLDAFQVLD
jgi:hypothetical protein